MAVARFGRLAKRSLKSYRSYGFCVKLTAVVILGLCFIFIWFLFSPNTFSVTYRRETFDDISEPVSGLELKRKEIKRNGGEEDGVKVKKIQSLGGKESEDKKKIHGPLTPPLKAKNGNTDQKKVPIEEKIDKEKAEEENESSVDEELKQEVETNEEGDGDLGDALDLEMNDVEKVNEEETAGNLSKKKRYLGPLFDPKAHYAWKLCSTRSKHNYIPCIDLESSLLSKLRSYRHHERSCPKTSVMCLVPLPHDGYETPVSWPDSKVKIMYKNVAHPKLAALIKSQDWVMEAGKHLIFPQNQTVLKGGTQHYLEFLEEMVPDIEWGKNIRVVLDIGCTDSSFVAALMEKNVLTLTLGIKDDLVDLAQLALERGFPTVVSPLAMRRLPFPSGVFDVIHCGECSVSWHSNDGKLLLEMNRILRPGGYFILSSKHNSREREEAISKHTASICWNILADKNDEVSEVDVKIYQKPEANRIYQLRRKKVPPMCKENENPDAAWYTSIKTCLHKIPSAIEERGTEWPEEWPKRLETFPDWTNNRENLTSESEHWKKIVNNSYLEGLGIDWSRVRNVMDMKAINGGFAAALMQKSVWVMNVVAVHLPDTLPLIYERGLIGVYHDWCEPFGTYPRSYDLLHADHLFSRLKNRCKQAVAIVVEMDRILRPGGWAVIRDKEEVLDPIGTILRSLNWEIVLTFSKDKEGILCAQKTKWRP